VFASSLQGKSLAFCDFFLREREWAEATVMWGGRLILSLGWDAPAIPFLQPKLFIKINFNSDYNFAQIVQRGNEKVISK
jgi:hypothetical protein